MVMDCAEAAKLLNEYLDQELNERTISQIRAHLEMCKPCFGNYEFNVALKKLVQTMETKPALLRGLSLKIENALLESQ
jgi:anti-sigma factor (TIGR02949 family)